jgi:hypothetical protein
MKASHNWPPMNTDPKSCVVGTGALSSFVSLSSPQGSYAHFCAQWFTLHYHIPHDLQNCTWRSNIIVTCLWYAILSEKQTKNKNHGLGNYVSMLPASIASEEDCSWLLNKIYFSHKEISSVLNGTFLYRVGEKSPYTQTIRTSDSI